MLPITHKDRFLKLGIRPPKGVLLHGPPGGRGRAAALRSPGRRRRGACRASDPWGSAHALSPPCPPPPHSRHWQDADSARLRGADAGHLLEAGRAQPGADVHRRRRQDGAAQSAGAAAAAPGLLG